MRKFAFGRFTLSSREPVRRDFLLAGADVVIE
jgi:hypothetical protein